MTQLSENDQISKTASGRRTGRVEDSDRKGEGAWLEMKEQQRSAWSRKLWSVGLGVLSLPWLTRWQWQRVLLVNKHQDIQQISSFKMWEVCHHLRASFIPLSVISSLYLNRTSHSRLARSHRWWVLRFVPVKTLWSKALPPLTHTHTHTHLHTIKCQQTHSHARKHTHLNSHDSGISSFQGVVGGE